MYKGFLAQGRKDDQDEEICKDCTDPVYCFAVFGRVVPAEEALAEAQETAQKALDQVNARED
ncbi:MULTISPECIES: hypothetical protein [Aerococcus]|uniref:hypothetical protein n=1 Tax=Aerococcus TaxID=1375 RepID=UPI0018A764F5|nr:MULTISPECIES: hypothetical protein [Aerococcus]MCY3036468.1 hypothetical protein [Aerococcus sp. Group 2]MCY3039429.1 hypothetical protein [Aerococcus sp. Group 2]MCY3041331.1 hypothetical protein [Aerococcus sp. Group 2]MCY3042883.1 hypothetical protein [Aerococcus sp. Group 2]MDK6520754.1 hypothetical protein [Aerococcus urinae]